MSENKDTTKKESQFDATKKDERSLFVSTEIPDKKILKESQSPASYLGCWDFYIVFFAVVLRFMIETEKKTDQIKKDKNEDFNFKKYFDKSHVFRWFIHILTALIGLFVLPQFFIVFIYNKYKIGLSDWTLIGSAVVGFLGGDILKILGKILLFILYKLTGYKHEEK